LSQARPALGIDITLATAAIRSNWLGCSVRTESEFAGVIHVPLPVMGEGSGYAERA
jgi:hypothetical protein